MAQSTDYIGNKLIISGWVKISRKKNEKRVGKQGNFKKRFYLFIFRQKRREGEREGEKHQCVVAVSYTHLTLPTTGSLCRSRWSPYH